MDGNGKLETLQSFLERVRDDLPAVVEVAEGIYGSREESSEARDFSNGDVLRLLAVVQRVNVTFEAVYSQASHRGLITLDRGHSAAQFTVLSHLPNGHVYTTFDELFDDAPRTVRATASLKVPPDRGAGSGEVIRTGDRLKLLEKSQSTASERWLRCRNLRTDGTFLLSRRLLKPGAKATPFAKMTNPRLESTASLDELYPLLPQRVRPVRHQGQIVRGEPAIPGLEPVDYDGELLLSRTEIVQACTWEEPDRIFELPASTDVCVVPRTDWYQRVGSVLDIHVASSDASPDHPRAAIVVDQDSLVPGCPKDTLILMYGLQEAEYTTLRARDQTYVLVPRDYPSLFKITMQTWPTVKDLLESGVTGDVYVGRTARQDPDVKELDSLYEHDVVRVTDTSLVCQILLITGEDEGVDVVELQRVRSQNHSLGPVQVALNLRAELRPSSQLVADVPLVKLLDSPSVRLPVQVTLSRPQAPVSQPDSELLHPSDDFLMSMSPLRVLGEPRRLRAAVVSVASPHPGSGDALSVDLISVPEWRALAVRPFITTPERLLQQAQPCGASDPLMAHHKTTAVIRVSEAELCSLDSDCYQAVAPPVPRRGSQPPPTLTTTPDLPERDPPKPPPRPPRSGKHHPIPLQPSVEPPVSPPPKSGSFKLSPTKLASKISHGLKKHKKPEVSEGLVKNRPRPSLPPGNPYNPLESPARSQSLNGDGNAYDDSEHYNAIGEKDKSEDEYETCIPVKTTKLPKIPRRKAPSSSGTGNYDAIGEEDSSEDDYDMPVLVQTTKPQIIPRGNAPSSPGTDFPPKDDNIAHLGKSEMLRFLQEFLKVDQCVTDTFRRLQIDGSRLVELRHQCTDVTLQTELGMREANKDWFALLHFINKSSGRT